MAAPKLTHVRLLVADFPGCFRFYRDVLGFIPSFGSEHDVYAEFVTGFSVLGLFQRPLMANVVGTAKLAPAVPAQDRFALTFGVADVDAAWAGLKRKGIAFITAPHDQPDWHLRVAHLRDPDGNLLELYSPLPR